MKKYLSISFILFGTTSLFASDALVDHDRHESRYSSYSSSSRHTSSSSSSFSSSSSSRDSDVQNKSYRDYQDELENKFRVHIVKALKKGDSLSFLLNGAFKKRQYDNVKTIVRSAIQDLGSRFFKAAQLGMHGESINDFVESLTSEWNFMELTNHQTTHSLQNTQRVFAHANGLIVRLKKGRDMAFSVYTKEDTENVQAFIAQPESTDALNGLRQTFNQKAKAESCKLFVGYGRDLPFPNDYNKEGIIVEPVPNSPLNCISLSRFLGPDAYDQIPHEMTNSLQSSLDQLIMGLGHLKYKGGSLFPDDSKKDDRYTSKKRKRDEDDHYGYDHPSSKRRKHS